MTLAITLQSVVNGQTQTIIRAEGGVLSLGREPENSVVVDSEAVSRQHACLGNFGNQWVFWDLGSSNGSWVNGNVVTEDQKVLLRLGDVVQLANFAFRIADGSGNVPARGVKPFGPDASLLVFERGEFVKEVALQVSGSQFVLGGAESDLPYGDADSLSQLSIVQTGQEIELFVGQDGDAVYLNDEAVSGSLALNDRDRINLAQYCIIVNRPTVALEDSASPARFATAASAPSELSEVAAYDRYHLPKHLSGNDDDWQSETGRRHVNRGKKFIFSGDAADAQPMREELQMTQAPDDARFGRGLSALHQASLGAFPSERTLVQRIAIAAGGVLLLLLFAWALSNMLASS